MEPIHIAAQNGHINVIDMLVKTYGVDPQAKADVRMHTYRTYIVRIYVRTYVHTLCTHTYVPTKIN